MRKLSIDRIEAIIGKPMPAVLMKQIDTLDHESSRVLMAAPLAAFGYRDDSSLPHTTFIGGHPGFVRVMSPKRVAIKVGLDVMPRLGSGVSFVFMLPGLGDTFRLNGSVANRGPDQLEVRNERTRWSNPPARGRAGRRCCPAPPRATPCDGAGRAHPRRERAKHRRFHHGESSMSVVWSAVSETPALCIVWNVK